MRSRLLPLRAAAAPLAAVLAAACLSACGGGSSPSTSGQGGAGTSSTQTGKQAQTGKQVFASAGCSSCHTLAAAGSTGTIGPDLDKLKPSFAAAKAQVTNGGGGMPRFAGRLSPAQIDAVARFVANSTHGGG